MRVLLAHNFYQQAGGEDAVFAAERDLLRERGVEVIEYTQHNKVITDMSLARVACSTIWGRQSRHALEGLLREYRPDIAHFHNTFPLISPAAYYACRAVRVPVLQTLHNYRLLCPSATFYRQGRPCEDCKGRAVAWPGVLHACYRGSRAATATVAGMLVAHRVLGTWSRLVHVYVALTEFARQLFSEGGLPRDRIAVKPNFLHAAPAPGEHLGGFALFVGRLVPEKGIATLLAAWRDVPRSIRLKIIGTGPIEPLGPTCADGIEWLGAQSPEEVLSAMRDAAFLVLPSEWYEGFPIVLLEAYASGLPIVASRLGSLKELVRDGMTGLHFTPGDSQDLAKKVRWATANPELTRAMGRNARELFEAEYTAERNFERLMELYQLAAQRARAGG
jgi:glycosyltransferase involved in cell wall biosynthesis